MGENFGRRQEMRFFEDFVPGLVVDLGEVIADRAEMIAFATRYDPLPFHLDHDVAHQSLMGGLSASGWHTAAMVMRLQVDGLLGGARTMGSPGAESLQWITPVRAGDCLRAKVTVQDARPSVSRPTIGIVRLLVEAVNQHGRPVMRLCSTVMFERRGG